MNDSNDTERVLNWLSMRISELESAYRLKIQGKDQFWEYDDYCCHPDEFIKNKLSDINRVANEYHEKNKVN